MFKICTVFHLSELHVWNTVRLFSRMFFPRHCDCTLALQIFWLLDTDEGWKEMKLVVGCNAGNDGLSSLDTGLAGAGSSTPASISIPWAWTSTGDQSQSWTTRWVAFSHGTEHGIRQIIFTIKLFIGLVIMRLLIFEHVIEPGSFSGRYIKWFHTLDHGIVSGILVTRLLMVPKEYLHC